MSIDRAAFFAAVRASPFGGRLTQDQVDGLEAMLATGGTLPRAHLAYALATAFHETGRAMQPVVENLNYTSAARIRAVWPSRFPSLEAAEPYVRNPRSLANKVYGGRLGNTGPDDGWIYRGRGLVKITGRDNYARAGRHLGLDLVGEPDLALDADHAAAILFAGMAQGWFTGKKLAEYFTDNGALSGAGGAAVAHNDPVNARRIVNALDRAEAIAGYHRAFLAALVAAERPGSAEPAVASARPPPAASSTLWARLRRLFTRTS